MQCFCGGGGRCTGVLSPREHMDANSVGGYKEGGVSNVESLLRWGTKCHIPLSQSKRANDAPRSGTMH